MRRYVAPSMFNVYHFVPIYINNIAEVLPPVSVLRSARKIYHRYTTVVFIGGNSTSTWSGLFPNLLSTIGR